MTVITALQQNLDKVQSVARDVERMEERAGNLRAALLALLTETSIAPSSDNDMVRFSC